jgi:transmembrane sensor
MTGADDQKTTSDSREDEAFEWLTRLTSGDVTTGELEALARWRDESPLNEAAFLEAGKLWHSVKPAVETAARRHKGVAAAALTRTNTRIGRRAVLGGALAASAAYLILRPPLSLWPSLSELTSDYRTGAGQQRRITTEGGVTIELNTRTSVDVRAADDAERIELIAGEASISTVANASRSIVVLAGDGRVTATDATFNMRCNGSSVRVTCIAGAIQVEQRGRPVSRLLKGQQVVYTDQGLTSAAEVDPAAVTAWQDGILVFHDEPLGRVIEEINRYWPGRIIVSNAGLGKRLVTARFKLDHLEDAITQIQLVFGANVTRLPGGVVVLSS